MSQLAKLAQPIDPRYVEKKPGKFAADFVSHPVIEQYLIGITGRIPRQEVVREIYDGEKLTGVVLRLTTVIDGQEVLVEEVGNDDGQAPNNGARLKNAVSDAYKRCCMRMTLGLALWAGADHYFLDKVLSGSSAPQAANVGPVDVSPVGPGAASPSVASAPAVADEPTYVGTLDVETIAGHAPVTEKTERATSAQWTLCRRRFAELGLDESALEPTFNLRYGFASSLAGKATAQDFAEWLKTRVRGAA